MLDKELIDLWCPAMYSIGLARLRSQGFSYIEFYKILGLDPSEDAFGLRKNEPVPENTRRFLEQLKGPHGKTLFAMYKAQGLKDDMR